MTSFIPLTHFWYTHAHRQVRKAFVAAVQSPREWSWSGLEHEIDIIEAQVAEQAVNSAHEKAMAQRQATYEAQRHLFFYGYPKIVPGQITWPALHRLNEWYVTQGFGNNAKHLEAMREEGYTAARAGLGWGLIDCVQAGFELEFA